MGKKKEALEYLKNSIVAGFVDWKHIKEDMDLDNLRKLPAFKEMMSDKKKLLKMVADRKIDLIKKAFGESFNYIIDQENMLIFATEHPKDVLEDIRAKLVKYAKAQWKHLFKNKQDYYITIIIPSPETFRKLVPLQNVGGFYSPRDKSLLASEAGYTLVHEFTHALHWADTDNRGIAHNTWFREGLATGFENSIIKNGVPTPIDNARLFAMQLYVNRGQNIKFSEFMKYSQAQFLARKKINISYSQSRYMTMWLWQTGMLKKYYEAYCDTYNDDHSGIKALEKLFDKGIDEVEKDWLKWFKELPPYTGFTRANMPFIGIRPERKPSMGGLKIAEVIEGYPAAKVGIKIGDLFTHIDGERIIVFNDLINLLLTCKPGQKIKITIKRNGKVMEFDLTLVERPKDNRPPK